MNKKSIKDAFFLYVEDDFLNRKVIELLMKKVADTSNFIIFENSENFEKKIKEMAMLPDVIFLDIHVAPFDGFEMLKILRSIPEYENKRIVALTASVMNEEIENLRMSGFNGAIGKPLDMYVFSTLLENILQGEEVWSI